MQIYIYTIEKKPAFQEEIDRYIKQASRFGRIEVVPLYDKRLKREESPAEVYAQLFLRYTRKGFNVILTPDGELMDSHRFAQRLLEGKGRVNFFIGGAYGFNREFKQRGFNLSLSPLTFSHQIAKLVLVEQIYRGLTILNNHPYDK